MLKKCMECLKLFESNRSTKVCSLECRNKRQNRLTKEQTLRKMSARELKKCAFCETEYRRKDKFCSKECKTRYNNIQYMLKPPRKYRKGTIPGRTFLFTNIGKVNYLRDRVNRSTYG